MRAPEKGSLVNKFFILFFSIIANDTELFAFIFLVKGLSSIVSIKPKELPFCRFSCEDLEFLRLCFQQCHPI